MREWLTLYNSKSGERGIYNRQSAVEKSMENGRRSTEYDFGTNPCSEIILRPYQFCNLTEVVVRADDKIVDLKRKIELATILGTIQSTLTDLKYLRKIWKDNTEEDRLLGVSLTGIMDNELLNSSSAGYLSLLLLELKQVAVDTNLKLSEKIGVGGKIVDNTVTELPTESAVNAKLKELQDAWDAANGG